jgi:hypothetical protein
MAVTAGDYGPVRVLNGEHKGQIGYYYDEDDDPSKAVVYLGEPFASDYVLIPHADLEKVDVESIHLEKGKRAYPWLAKKLGVP